MRWNSYRLGDASLFDGTFDLADVGAVEREPDTESPSWCAVFLRWGHSYRLHGDEARRFLADFEEFIAVRRIPQSRSLVEVDGDR
jgi:hypothetical protein